MVGLASLDPPYLAAPTGTECAQASKRINQSGIMDWTGKVVLVTGGTGSFGRQFIRWVLQETPARKVIVFSRDELKQWEMAQAYPGEPRIRFFLGDVRDCDRLHRAFDGVDFVVHAAAMKQVPAAEYNPFEAVKTNILGAKNVIDAAIDRGVKRVVALSTDKASSPVNLYGATKLVSDKLFIDGNAYTGGKDTRFAVVRYGNVVGSRGSVVPLFKKLAGGGTLPITDPRMTRFWITLPQSVRFVADTLARMHGGELFVPKIPSIRVTDLARAVAPEAELKIIGMRPCEKLHEELISRHEAHRTADLGSCYQVLPDAEWWAGAAAQGTAVPDGFQYTSDTNAHWLTVDELRAMVCDD
jgi:UDP-N-acetylglucosamine 4,6-dehydratase